MVQPEIYDYSKIRRWLSELHLLKYSTGGALFMRLECSLIEGLNILGLEFSDCPTFLLEGVQLLLPL